MSKRWFVLAVLVTAALSLVVSLGVSSAQPSGAAAGTLKVGAAQGIPQLNPVIRTFAWEEGPVPTPVGRPHQVDSVGCHAHRISRRRGTVLEGQQDVDVQAP